MDEPIVTHGKNKGVHFSSLERATAESLFVKAEAHRRGGPSKNPLRRDCCAGENRRLNNRFRLVPGNRDTNSSGKKGKRGQKGTCRANVGNAPI